MFDDWPDSFEPTARRVVDPPVAVTVDLGLAIPTAGSKFGANELPMRVRAGGLRVSGQVPGTLFAWARTSSGDWLGLAEFTISTANERGRLPMKQWCSQRALTPRTSGPEKSAP